jgi:hypothetical protein
MELTQEVIGRMVGGQLEVQNRNEGYLYRGEISAVKLEGEGDSLELIVSFSWFAKMESDFEWSATEPKPYKVSLLIYSVSDIGEGRIFLSSWIIGENTTIFPPDGSKLDPNKVKGLVLS